MRKVPFPISPSTPSALGKNFVVFFIPSSEVTLVFFFLICHDVSLSSPFQLIIHKLLPHFTNSTKSFAPYKIINICKWIACSLMKPLTTVLSPASLMRHNWTDQLTYSPTYKFSNKVTYTVQLLIFEPTNSHNFIKATVL